MESVEGSLRALQTDYIDILLLHRPDALVEPDTMLRIFGKPEIRGQRRMAVTLARADTLEAARSKACAAAAKLCISVR